MFPRINGQPSNTNNVESTGHRQERNSDATSSKRGLPEQVQNELLPYAKKNKTTPPEQTASSAIDFFTAEVAGTSQASFKGYDTDAPKALSEADYIQQIEALREAANSGDIGEIEAIVEQLYIIEPMNREDRGEAKKPLLARDVFAIINAYPYLEDYSIEEGINNLIYKGMGPDYPTNEPLLLASVAIALLPFAAMEEDENSDTEFETSEQNMPLDKDDIKGLLNSLLWNVDAIVQKRENFDAGAPEEYSAASQAAKRLTSLYRKHGDKFIEKFTEACTIIQNKHDLEEATNSTSNE